MVISEPNQIIIDKLEALRQLDLAIEMQDEQLFTVLISRVYQDLITDDSLLIEAINNKYYHLVNYIGSLKDINDTTVQGETPLFFAVRTGDYQIVNSVIKYMTKEKINKENRLKQTALNYAIKRGYQNIVQLLLNYGAIPSLKSLMMSLESTTPIVRLISQKMININEQDTLGKTALMISLNKNKLEMSQALIDSGAKINIADYSGKTTFDYASSEEARRFLENYMTTDDYLFNAFIREDHHKVAEYLQFNVDPYRVFGANLQFLPFYFRENFIDILSQWTVFCTKDTDYYIGLMNFIYKFLHIRSIEQSCSALRESLIGYLKQISEIDETKFIDLDPISRLPFNNFPKIDVYQYGPLINEGYRGITNNFIEEYIYKQQEIKDPITSVNIFSEVSHPFDVPVIVDYITRKVILKTIPMVSVDDLTKEEEDRQVEMEKYKSVVKKYKQKLKSRK